MFQMGVESTKLAYDKFLRPFVYKSALNHPLKWSVIAKRSSGSCDVSIPGVVGLNHQFEIPTFGEAV